MAPGGPPEGQCKREQRLPVDRLLTTPSARRPWLVPALTTRDIHRIYKAKYNETAADKDRKSRALTTSAPNAGAALGEVGSPEKKPRDKSRTRTIFGRKKSGV